MQKIDSSKGDEVIQIEIRKRFPFLGTKSFIFIYLIIWLNFRSFLLSLLGIFLQFKIFYDVILILKLSLTIFFHLKKNTNIGVKELLFPKFQ